MTKIKICGITALEDALFAARAGADMLGLNFYKKSPRYIDPESARVLCDELKWQLRGGCPMLVGVFVNELVSNVASILNKVGLDFAQLSGDESGDVLKALKGRAFKAIRPRDKAEASGDARYYGQYAPRDGAAPSLLVDAFHKDLYGGTGQQASVEIAQAAKDSAPRLMLAGGLSPENVAGRVQAIQPWGVDVASGVERDTPGQKDYRKIGAFIQAVRSAG